MVKATGSILSRGGLWQGAFTAFIFTGPIFTGPIVIGPIVTALTFSVLIFIGLNQTCTAQSEENTILNRWENAIRPILSKQCISCHNELKRSGQLSLETIRGLLGSTLSGSVVDGKNSAESLILKVILPNAESHMPPDGQLSDGDIESLKKFIGELVTDPGYQAWKNETEQSSSKAPQNATLDNYPAALPPQLVIDFAVSNKLAEKGLTAGAKTDDSQFARRIYLDFLGRTPTSAELRLFLESLESNKRETLIDSLLNSPEHAVHLSELLHALLIGRKDANGFVQSEKAGWFSYLRNAIEKDRPWNEVAAEILLARPADESRNGAVWYLYSRKNNHQEIAEAVSRDFFGVRIDCAQCHDHPLANEILQRHYWGLTAFFNRSTNTETSKGFRLKESAIGGFAEFANIRGSSAPNELVFLGTEPIPETRPAKDVKEEDRDDLYNDQGEGEPRVPKFSRRQQFVEKVLTNHPLVSQAMVNRIWGHMLGRGLIHPIDAMDSFHPASHPELLHWLSRDFERRGYSIRHLLRSIALSQTYQLASSASQTQDPSLFSYALAKPLTAESFHRSIGTALELKNPDAFYALENRLLFSRIFPDVLAEESLANVSQGLMLSNSPLIQRFVSASESQLLQRLSAETDTAQASTQLFLALLHRKPDNEELQKCLTYLSNTSRSREKLLEDLTWALITSPEFRFNH